MGINKTEKSHVRYKHWLWNSQIISLIEEVCLRIASFLWRKQYGNG